MKTTISHDQFRELHALLQAAVAHLPEGAERRRLESADAEEVLQAAGVRQVRTGVGQFLNWNGLRADRFEEALAYATSLARARAPRALATLVAA